MSDDCPECDGEGIITDTKKIECKQCKGNGWVAAGQHSRFTCPMCGGTGGDTISNEKTCPRCKGSGSRRTKGKKQDEGDMVGKRVLGADGQAAPKAKSRAKAKVDEQSAPPPSVAPPAGASNGQAEDVEAPPETAAARETTTKEPTATREPASSSRSAPVRCEFTISMAAVGNTLGTILFVIGFVLFAKGEDILAYMGGAFVALIGGVVLLKTNLQKCTEAWQSAMASGSGG